MKKMAFISGCAAFMLLSSPASAFAEVIDPVEITKSDCMRSYSAPESDTRADRGRYRFWTVTYDNGRLTIIWHNFIANCCPEGFDSHITVEDGEILSELQEVGMGECSCVCPYDITTIYEGIAPGHYRLIVDDYSTPVIAELELEDGFSTTFEAQPNAVNEVSTSGSLLSTDGRVIKARYPGDFTVEIFDAAGSKVYSLTATDETEVSLSSLHGGIYIVRLTSAVGETATLPVLR